MGALGNVDAKGGARHAHVCRRLVDGVVHDIGRGSARLPTAAGLGTRRTSRGDVAVPFPCHPSPEGHGVRAVFLFYYRGCDAAVARKCFVCVKKNGSAYCEKKNIQKKEDKQPGL
ncbi:hypothetical protein [Pandoravirus japonicus]|uniref:Uncharacterized protein n=1 Tax=Pandoravirus japonicus TaxID=2823154 RepID=A0A811BRT5_9VIRU|nr:hypothetical protein [Pandoravirus japonicus]